MLLLVQVYSVVSRYIMSELGMFEHEWQHIFGVKPWVNYLQYIQISVAVDCQTSIENSISELHYEVNMSNSFMMLDVKWVETVPACIASNVLWEIWTVELCRGKYLQEGVNVWVVCDCRYTWSIYNKNCGVQCQLFHDYHMLSLCAIKLQQLSLHEYADFNCMEKCCVQSYV